MNSLILVFVFIAVVIIVFKLLHRTNLTENKGKLGESIVIRELQKLQPKDFIVLNNILIKSRNYTNQIDHIVISIYGIFVIETKHYGGWIHGHQNSDFWSQTFKTKRIKFRNPVLQTLGHIKALNRVLKDFHPLTYHPIVVFTGSAELKNIDTEMPVIYAHQIIRTFKNICNHTIYTEHELTLIKKKILESALDENKEIENHIKNVYNHKLEYDKREKMGLCPRCGKDLRIVQGQYGSFYGCSGFPKCKYSKNQINN